MPALYMNLDPSKGQCVINMQDFFFENRQRGKEAVTLAEDNTVFGNQSEMGAFLKNFLLNQQNPCDPENCGSNRWLMFLFM